MATNDDLAKIRQRANREARCPTTICFTPQEWRAIDADIAHLQNELAEARRGEAFSDRVALHWQTEVERLRVALVTLRQGIIDHATDTVWMGPGETAVDNITLTLGDAFSCGEPETAETATQPAIKERGPEPLVQRQIDAAEGTSRPQGGSNG